MTAKKKREKEICNVNDALKFKPFTCYDKEYTYWQKQYKRKS